MLALRAVFYTVVIPGSVTVGVPYLLARDRLAGALADWGMRETAGLVPVLLGAAILLRCIWDFATAGRGTLAPIDPPTALVVRGLYRYVRNPMYLGALLMLAGEAFALRSMAIVWWGAAWFTTVNLIVLFHEEPTLTRRFGDSYRDYRSAVGRWIPGLPRKS